MLQQALEKCRKILGTAGKLQVGYRTFPRLVSIILRVLRDVTELAVVTNPQLAGLKPEGPA